MAARALLALPELDDEDATRAARDGSDTMVLVGAEHDRVAGVHKSGLVAGVADELACEVNDRELYISLRVEMAWGHGRAPPSKSSPGLASITSNVYTLPLS